MTLNQISGVITTVMVNVFVHGIPLDIGILKDRVTVMNNYFSAEGDVSNFVLLRESSDAEANKGPLMLQVSETAQVPD